MFMVDGDTIRMSIGDTGTLKIKATGTLTLGTNDRVLFTVNDAYGGVMIQRALPAVNNIATVTFANSDTDEFPAGTYWYDVRYIVNPYYDSDGNIIDGDIVTTPKERQQFILVPVVGEV